MPKHAIKRIDRLLGNGHLRREQIAWYREIAHRAIGSNRLVVIPVDWTELDQRMWTLSAAVAGPGRGIPIYQETYRKVRGGERFFKLFLRRLLQVLPAHCRPILVADAGFRKTFFRACRAHRLDFVVRVRKPATVGNGPHHVSYASLVRTATELAQCLSEAQVYGSNCRGELVRLVLGATPGREVREDDGVYQRRALEPWLLATTFTDVPADEIVRVYALRMQIEETFRDTKNGWLGWGLSLSRTRTCARMSNLLLLAALATLAVVLVGLAADQEGLARRFQANTTRRRRVLAVFRLGMEVLSSHSVATRMNPRILHQRIATIAKPWTEHHERYGGPPPHDLYCPDCGEHFEQYGWPPLDRQLLLPHVSLTPPPRQ